jgi:hypothetical protein
VRLVQRVVPSESKSATATASFEPGGGSHISRGLTDDATPRRHHVDGRASVRRKRAAKARYEAPLPPVVVVQVKGPEPKGMICAGRESAARLKSAAATKVEV